MIIEESLSKSNNPLLKLCIPILIGFDQQLRKGVTFECVYNVRKVSD